MLSGRTCSAAWRARASTSIRTLQCSIVVRRGHATSKSSNEAHALGTITTDTPSNASIGQLLDSIKAQRSSVAEKNGGKTALLVLLLTPSFAQHALDPELPLRVWERIFGTRRWNRRLNAIAAVVDRLPATVDGGEGGNEGLAYLVSSEDEELEELSYQVQGLEERKRQLHDKPGTLSFAIIPWPDKKEEQPYHVHLPLAQTIFSTGRVSTLMHTLYLPESYSDSDAYLPEGTSTSDLVPRQHGPLDSYTIPLPFAATPRSHLPLLPLTPAREIKECIGNILRQLSTTHAYNTNTLISFDSEAKAETGTQPASTELESAISSYFSTTDIPTQTVGVWALIIPKTSLRKLWHIGQSVKRMLHFDEAAITRGWTTNNKGEDANRKEDVPAIIDSAVRKLLFHNGARLCKVLSGGGGWGRKAGLLSLDPDAGYGDSVLMEQVQMREEAMLTEKELYASASPALRAPSAATEDEDDTPPLPPSLQSEQDKALGNMMREDEVVMFFLQPPNPTAQQDSASWQQVLSSSSHAAIFGALPSSMDDMSPLPSELGVGERAKLPAIVYSENVFGALSAGGMAVSQISLEKRFVRSKVDVPFARFTWLAGVGVGGKQAGKAVIGAGGKVKDAVKEESRGGAEDAQEAVQIPGEEVRSAARRGTRVLGGFPAYQPAQKYQTPPSDATPERGLSGVEVLQRSGQHVRPLPSYRHQTIEGHLNQNLIHKYLVGSAPALAENAQSFMPSRRRLAEVAQERRLKRKHDSRVRNPVDHMDSFNNAAQATQSAGTAMRSALREGEKVVGGFPAYHPVRKYQGASSDATSGSGKSAEEALQRSEQLAQSATPRQSSALGESQEPSTTPKHHAFGLRKVNMKVSRVEAPQQAFAGTGHSAALAPIRKFDGYEPRNFEQDGDAFDPGHSRAYDGARGEGVVRKLRVHKNATLPPRDYTPAEESPGLSSTSKLETPAEEESVVNGLIRKEEGRPSQGGVGSLIERRLQREELAAQRDPRKESKLTRQPPPAPSEQHSAESLSPKSSTPSAEHQRIIEWYKSLREKGAGRMQRPEELDVERFFEQAERADVESKPSISRAGRHVGSIAGQNRAFATSTRTHLSQTRDFTTVARTNQELLRADVVESHFHLGSDSVQIADVESEALQKTLQRVKLRPEHVEELVLRHERMEEFLWGSGSAHDAFCAFYKLRNEQRMNDLARKAKTGDMNNGTQDWKVKLAWLKLTWRFVRELEAEAKALKLWDGKGKRDWWQRKDGLFTRGQKESGSAGNLYMADLGETHQATRPGTSSSDLSARPFRVVTSRSSSDKKETTEQGRGTIASGIIKKHTAKSGFYEEQNYSITSSTSVPDSSEDKSAVEGSDNIGIAPVRKHGMPIPFSPWRRVADILPPITPPDPNYAPPIPRYKSHPAPEPPRHHTDPLTIDQEASAALQDSEQISSVEATTPPSARKQRVRRRPLVRRYEVTGPEPVARYHGSERILRKDDTSAPAPPVVRTFDSHQIPRNRQIDSALTPKRLFQFRTDANGPLPYLTRRTRRRHRVAAAMEKAANRRSHIIRRVHARGPLPIRRLNITAFTKHVMPHRDLKPVRRIWAVPRRLHPSTPAIRPQSRRLDARRLQARRFRRVEKLFHREVPGDSEAARQRVEESIHRRHMKELMQGRWQMQNASEAVKDELWESMANIMAVARQDGTALKHSPRGMLGKTEKKELVKGVGAFVRSGGVGREELGRNARVGRSQHQLRIVDEVGFRPLDEATLQRQPSAAEAVEFRPFYNSP